MTDAPTPLSSPLTTDLADDVRFIAAHEADPRKEDRLYEAAETIDGLCGALDKAVARLETIRVRLCRTAVVDETEKVELVDYIRQCEAEANATLARVSA